MFWLRRLRYRYSKHYLICSAFCGLLSILIFPIYKLIAFRVMDRITLNNCPMCFGKDLCSLLNDHFMLNGNYFWTNLLNICLFKPIIFGLMNDQMVVLKWSNDNSFSYHQPVDLIESDVALNKDQIIEALNPMFSHPNYELHEEFVLCPTSDNLGLLLEPIFLKRDVLKSDALKEYYHNMLYSMQANKELILQQIVQEWAVARFLGVCGDVSVSEYCGPSLTSAFSALTWQQRSLLARQLLQFAFNATFDNSLFGFYFTDMSPDNFAVSDGLEIRLVDLDNVIVVDKNPTDKPSDWEMVHTNHHSDEIQGFAFSTQDICSHKISDTNVYSICQGILSASSYLPGGLLHSAPPSVSGLEKLLEDCVSPPADTSRFDIAKSILEVLQ